MRPKIENDTAGTKYGRRTRKPSLRFTKLDERDPRAVVGLFDADLVHEPFHQFEAPAAAVRASAAASFCRREVMTCIFFRIGSKFAETSQTGDMPLRSVYSE